jgi:UDP-2,4-diacetamido-2,4,6-trideoxy-beta-L-altropyranose hydrolase
MCGACEKPWRRQRALDFIPVSDSHSIGTLCIRADAGARMGVGHVMRCLALAQAWKLRGGRVVLLTHAEAPALIQRLRDEGLELQPLLAAQGSLEEAAEVVNLAAEYPAKWLVLDGYHFTPDYRAALKVSGLRLLIIDDLADTDLSAADILLNQNAYATAQMYPVASRLLLGSQHALLRREFLPWRSQRGAEPEEAREVLITLGGGDPDNVTLRVLHLLAGMTERRLVLKVIVGSANPHVESLRAALPMNHEIEVLVNPPNLPELMSRAHVAISAAGSSCWELACLGLPMLLIITADNQRGVAARLEELGLAVCLGWHEDFPKQDTLECLRDFLEDAPRRRRMSEEARLLVDGRGAGRVVEAMLAHPLTLRRAMTEDARLLWEWVNDPAVRASAFSTDPVPWEGHQGWFARRLADKDCVIFIGLDACDVPIGQVRFEGEAETATVDVSVAPNQRGKGYAPRLLRLAVATLFDDPRWQTVQAWIKPENLASRQSFERAGFHCQGEESIHGHPAIGYHVHSHEFL